MDVRKIENGVAAGVSYAVGDLLSTIPTASGTKPAVVLERMFQKDGTNAIPPRPDFPYCSVSFQRVVDSESPLIRKEFEGDDRVYSSMKDVYISVKFFGNRLNSVDDISSKAHLAFEVEAVRYLIQDVAEQGVEVANKSDIRYINSVASDLYIELREFDIVVRLEDQFIEKNSAYFDTIGEVGVDIT